MVTHMFDNYNCVYIIHLEHCKWMSFLKTAMGIKQDLMSTSFCHLREMSISSCCQVYDCLSLFQLKRENNTLSDRYSNSMLTHSYKSTVYGKQRMTCKLLSV